MASFRAPLFKGMKTAVRPRIALATYEHAPQLAPDDQLLVPAFARIGIDAEPAVWSNDDVIWETFDGVLVRSCWDYHLRAGAFHAWLERLDASRLPVWNSVALLQWNAHKRYLLDLEQRGVAIVPTAVVAQGDVPGVRHVIEESGWTRVVIKPAVSASGFETHVIDPANDPAAWPIVERVAATGDVLVQPFAEEIPRDGEYSLMFIDGGFSHGAIKRAAAHEFRVQTEHGGSVDLIEISDDLIEQGANVLAALPETPVYARVDGIVRDGRLLLMELELIEPNLFLELQPGADTRLAEAVARRLD